MTDCQPLRRRLDEEEAGGSCCANCGVGAAAESIRIATWANVAPTIQAYVDFYSKVNPEASPIRLSVFPSLKELQLEALLDVTVGSKLYDGFAIPPMLMADLLEQRGLASLDSIATSREWKDLLPYYRSHVATFDGSIRAMPLFSGNQMLLLFRKDYLDSKNLKTPKTWGEFLRIAASLHNEPLGNDGEKIYGACIGRLSEQACRQKRDQTGQPCNSLSMTYLGVQLSSMTQMKGSSTGWLFDNDASNGMNPLLKPTLEYSLVITEEMMKYGAPKELDADSSLNLELFREGRCAMTLSADHPADLLQGLNVGFAPLPGAFKVLDRETDTLVQCDSELCPYATNYEELGHVNMVPFGAHDMVIGGVSALVPETKQAGVKEFMQFVMNTRLNISLREQPMTYSGISSSNILGYEKLIEGLTSNKNGAIPFRAPTAFQLLSDADTQVYEYLKARNYSHSNRVHLTESIEKTWERTIQRHDDQVLAVPTSIFYEKSLGSFTPEASSDVYIGTPLRLTGWALGGISCLTSIIMALWVWRNREERVVRASQPIFLWMLCAGTLIMGSCIFPFGIEDDLVSFRGVDIACMASIWLYSIGFVMTYSALFSKMWRINRVSIHTSMLLYYILCAHPLLTLYFFCLFYRSSETPEIFYVSSSNQEILFSTFCFCLDPISSFSLCGISQTPCSG